MIEEFYERSLPIMRSTDADVAITGNKVSGYAVVYGAKSVAPVELARGQYSFEVIDKGAFTESLSRNIPFVFNHKEYAELADTSSKTLRLTEDDKGIRFEMDLPEYANILRRELEIGAIRGMSFNFRHPAIEMRDNIRHIVKGELGHISAVYNPAYSQTSIKLERANTNKKKIELLSKI